MKGLVTIHDGIADVRFTAYLDVSGDTSISAILPSLSNIVGFQSPLDSMGFQDHISGTRQVVRWGG